MNVLFVMRHGGNVRNFEWVIRLLDERGHRVHLAFQREHELELAERLAAELAGVTVGLAPVGADPWTALAWDVGRVLDYLRYLEPRYREARFLRERAERDVPASFVRAAQRGLLRRRAVRRALAAVLRLVERHVPILAEFPASMRSGGHDVLVVTPLVSEPSQHDFVRGVQAAGYPAVLAVHSWDNLTNKGLIRVRPDRVYVWNELQRQEAVELHELPGNRIAVVGAHSYDHWFQWRPELERTAFCSRIGLDPTQPYLLYVGSSVQIAPDEPDFVRRWIAALRADDDLRDVGVLVRPHPYAARLWRDLPLAGERDVVVWPPTGAEPRDEASRSDYFHSIHHAAAVVGLNTSALHEAAIVGRRTYSLVRTDGKRTQDGTLHFRYLRRENGGPLTAARTLDEHLSDLRGVLAGSEEDGWWEPYVRAFLRPDGLDAEGAPRFVSDLESFVADFRPQAGLRERGLGTPLLRPVAAAVARARSRTPSEGQGRLRRVLRRRTD